MINLADFPSVKKVVHVYNKTVKKRFVGQLLGGLFLASALGLTACSYDSHTPLTLGGKADYSHYPKGGGLFVSATFDSEGKLWRIVPEKQHIYVDYSSDFGKTFSAPILINVEEQPIKVSGENRPNIAVDNAGRIYVVYAAEGIQPVTVYFSVSTDKGRSFSPPAPLSEKASTVNSLQGKLVLSPSGLPYVFWHDDRDRTDWKQQGNAVYYSTISNENILSANQKLADTLCECCRFAVAFDTDAQPVLLARFVYPGNIRDHGLIKAQANGKPAVSWRVTFDQWNLEACPDHGAAITISDNKYHIAWFTQGDERKGLFYGYSVDAGKHFSKPLPIGHAEKLPSHPDIIAKGKRVILTWIEFDGSKNQLMVMQSNDSGLSWLPAKSIAESAAEVDFPFFLSHNEKIFVSWNSKNEGYRLIPVN